MTAIVTVTAVLTDLPPARRYWVALSGGLDSTVLLHALAQCNPPVPLEALHLHHGLSPHADQWQVRCEAFCARLGVPLTTRSLKVTAAGKGLEDAARQARYRAFDECLGEDELMLLAHHADDQVETLLLRLLRGSGPHGLAGMARQRALGLGRLYRPFLPLTRAHLKAYAEAHQLEWVEDESNAEHHFDRNYLRHQVVAPLRERWPTIASAWAQSAALCGESDALLQELARGDLRRVTCFQDSHGPSLGPVLDIEGLGAFTPARRHNLLRYWLQAQQLPPPGRELLNQLDSQFIGGREDAQARLAWAGLELRRFRRGLYLMRSQWLEHWPGSGWQPQTLVLEPGRHALPGGGELTLSWDSEARASQRLRPDLPPLILAWRRGGERCRPAGRAHSQKLKKLLQDWALEPWWRDSVPLLYSGEQLVAVGDLWVCAGFEAEGRQPGYRLSWNPLGQKPDKF